MEFHCMNDIFWLGKEVIQETPYTTTIWHTYEQLKYVTPS